MIGRWTQLKFRKLKLWKLMIALVLVLAMIALLIILLVGKKPVEEPDTSKKAVFKTTEPDESMELHGSKEFAGIEEVLKDPRLQGATTAISIRKAADGEVVYANSGDVRVRPASVMKLLTGAAAFEKLGPDYSFKTELYADGAIKDGVLQGDLYLRGQGDPTVMKADLDGFAVDLKEKGVHTINGNIYGDDSWYDDIRLSQDLNWSDELHYTGAQVSALTISPNKDYDAGTTIIEVYPGKKVGEPGIIKMVPKNNYVHIVNQVQTVAKKGDKRIQVEREHGSNTLVVSGTIPTGAAKTRTWISVWEPTDFAIDLFRNAIVAEGIQLAPVHQVGRGIVPDSATLLTAKQSMSLEKIFIPFMKLSNNGHGEVLVKEMGRAVEGEGGWDKGLSVMNHSLSEMGIDMETMLLRDGSGMSHKTLVTANEVTKLLYAIQTKSWYPEFLNSLPVAGVEERFVGGTLRYRMKETAAAGNVRAKTGTLNGVTSLAGYVESKDGETLIFTVIINNYLDDSTYELLDQIAVMLANH